MKLSGFEKLHRSKIKQFTLCGAGWSMGLGSQCFNEVPVFTQGGTYMKEGS